MMVRGVLSLAPLVAVLVVGCNAPDKRRPDAASATRDSSEWIVPDAPPPSVDAGPPPVVSCKAHGNPNVDAGVQCELPPSECLDPSYLIYYTGAQCVDGTCEFTRELLYCGGLGCINGGCNPGFT